MSEPSPPRPSGSDLGAALGRLPSGLFILTVRRGDQSTGMLASWVQQAGFDPPMLTVAFHKERYVADWVRASGRFALNQIPAGNKTLLRHFGKGFAAGEPAFDGVSLAALDDPAGPVLAEALAYIDRRGRGRAGRGRPRRHARPRPRRRAPRPVGRRTARPHPSQSGLHY